MGAGHLVWRVTRERARGQQGAGHGDPVRRALTAVRDGRASAAERAAAERASHEPVTLVCAPAGQRQDRARRCGCPALPAPHVAWVTLEPTDDEPGRLWDAVLTALEFGRRGARRTQRSPRWRRRCASRATRSCRCSSTRSRSCRAAGAARARRRARPALARVPGAAVVPAPARAGHAAARADRPLGPGAAAARPARARPPGGDPRAPTSRSRRRRPPSCSTRTGSQLSDDLVRALHARTEGWSAGLRLAALSLQGREDPERFIAEFAGDDRVVGDYLLAEVLDRQPPRLRAFLLRTSLVDRICGSLADALTGDAHGADTLATLERTNGFVLGVDGHREWFRYHRLFAKLLRTRAERELADELPRPARPRGALVRRARGVAVDALEHAVAAGRLGPRGRGRRRALVRPLRPRRRRRRPLAARGAPAPIALETRRRAGRRARLRGARRRATPTRPSSTWRTPSGRRPACPSRAAAGTWRRWRSRTWRRRGCEGDFDGALEAADALLAEAAAHGGASDAGASGARARDARRGRALGPPARPRRARSSRKAVTLARLHAARLRRGLRAQRPRAAST